MSEASIDLSIGPEMLARLSKPGPRYTSYPTAVAFHDGFKADDYARALKRLGESGEATSLYVHLPFCRSLCHYCACNVVISKKAGVAGAYLDTLEAELALVRAALGAKPRVTQLHLGGGTPTYLTPDELRRLHSLLGETFDVTNSEEMAVEIDPRVTTPEHLKVLADLGWNRASFGVQDFDPEVQRAVNRVQSVEETMALVTSARELGYEGINLDLIYGLPFQKQETFASTLDTVLEIRPDRIALYSYAHVPWMRIAQTRFEKRGYPMPGPNEKYGLFRDAVKTFTKAGYRHLGMDHFALPTDELSLALERGDLHRNFQGYTVRRADHLVGLGISAISSVSGVYSQNAKEVELYRETIEGGSLPVIRGFELSQDDLDRREVITALMTASQLPEDFVERFAVEISQMDDLEEDGLLRRTAAGLEITPLGRFFIRNVAMVFDRHMPKGDGRTFSKTV